MIKQFADFVREQGVIGLAIGFILGGAVAKVVSSLVEDLVNPLIGLALGSADGLKEASFKVGEATIAYGSFLSTVLDFLVIAAVIFMVVRIMGIDKMDKKKA
jgi:large conductance mechanosensitive channel